MKLDSFKYFQSRNFTCCGIHLTDLHAVVEHFEVCHVVVADNQQAFGQYQNALASGAHLQPPSSYYNDPIPITAQPQPNYHHAFDPDDMELELDNNSQPSSGGTPPDKPITTPLTSYANSSFLHSRLLSKSTCIELRFTPGGFASRLSVRYSRRSLSFAPYWCPVPPQRGSSSAHWNTNSRDV